MSRHFLEENKPVSTRKSTQHYLLLGKYEQNNNEISLYTSDNGTYQT